jgi:hypothetical protein
MDRVDHGHAIREDLVRLSCVEDGAIRALVLDDHVALAKDPVTEEGDEGTNCADARALASPAGGSAVGGTATRSCVLP